jgi:hypothetical protein
MNLYHRKLNLDNVERPSSSRHSSQKQTQILCSNGKTTAREAAGVEEGPVATWCYLELLMARSPVGMILSHNGLTLIKMRDRSRSQKTWRVFHPRILHAQTTWAEWGKLGFTNLRSSKRSILKSKRMLRKVLWALTCKACTPQLTFLTPPIMPFRMLSYLIDLKWSSYRTLTSRWWVLQRILKCTTTRCIMEGSSSGMDI